jgi:hypothetical protein
MELGETIRLTVLPGAGIAFCDFDAVRRLSALGFRGKDGGIRKTTKSKVQNDFLRGRKIRTLDQYRALVDDPRSNGPMHWYDPGTTLLMQRTIKPKRETVYYLILDTAIGSQEGFIKDMMKEKRVRVDGIGHA